MKQGSAEKDIDKGGEFPSPPNEYWTVKIDLYGWLVGNYDIPMLRSEEVPSRKDPARVTGVYVFERTPVLEEAIREFWNPTTPDNKKIVKVIQAQKTGRHVKLAIEKKNG